MAHISQDCHTRLAAEKQATPGTSHGLPPATTPTITPKTDKKLIICFNCHQAGHKSPQCTKKLTNTVKRIQIPINRVKPLKDNEVMATIEGQVLPTTIDSGAEITLVPEECVGVEQFTGEMVTLDAYNMSKSVGKKCNIKITVSNRVFSRAAVAQPGDDISWTALVSFDRRRPFTCLTR